MAKPFFLALSFLIALFYVPGFSQTPDFTSNIVEGCAPLVVKFTDKSTGSPITSWEWDMGNGLPIYEQHPTTTFLHPGNYTVKLTINKGNGEKAITRTSYIKVYANPVAAFTSTPPQGCFPLPVTFTDQSTPESGSLVKWEWDFGDGTAFSNDKNPQHVYDYIGGYHVVLRVTNSYGCEKTLSKLNYVKISTGAKADFNLNAPNNCNPPTEVNFTDNSESVGALTYAWNFGDGTSSDQKNPVHAYTKPGTYSVSLNIINDAGCLNKVTKTNVITIGSVKANFTAPAKVCAGQQLEIQNTSSPAPNGARWDFGDGNFQYGIAPYYSYSTPGTYTLKLESNFGACTDIVSKTIEVLDKPTVAFTADKTTGCATPTTINFTTSTSETLTYKWDFGDGFSSTEKNPKHVYNKVGEFTVTLVATNSIGCSETISFHNYIRIRKPQAAFYGQADKGCAPLSVSPQYYWQEYGEPIAEYVWVWGDGDTTKGESNPTHIYTTAGYHNYTLTYTTVSGCKVTVSGPGVNVGVKPDINFTAAPPVTCAFKGIAFKDITTGVLPDEWWWEFGDGGSSNSQNPVYHYSDTGTFNVRLIAKNHGCPDTLVIEKIVTIKGPIALFTDSFSCGNKQTRYFKDRSIEANSWLWNFGDGKTSTAQNPEHTYEKAGTYTVSLTVENDTCQHTNTRRIIVTQAITDFTTSTTDICTGEQITFTAPNINNNDYYYYYSWNFGDGNYGSGYYNDASINHLYNLPGTYDVKLFWYDGNGCSDSVVKKQHIKANGPRAGFIVPTGIICAGTAVVFQDTSSGNPAALKTWTWSYGDGTVENKSSPPFSHIYNQPGYYSVSLTVTDEAGCKSNAIQYSTFNILKPTSQFESPDLVSCTEKPIRFVNYSFGADNDYHWSFGDGKISTAYQPTVEYSQEGLYEIKLITKDMFGCTDTMTRTGYIKIADPKALFTVSDSIASCPPLVIDFKNKSENFNTYQWDFGDNTRPAPNENPSHFYALPGTYFAKLKITSPGGCIDSTSQKLIVKGPTGDFSYDVTDGCRPLTVKFTGRTTSTASFIWDFNDGKVEPGGPEITYAYTSMGQYLPRMILVDPDGCRVPFPGPDTITVLGAESLLKANTDIVCDSGFVQFTNLSFANERITNYKWTFESGKTSNETDPSYYYTTPGRYPVELITSTISGCKDTVISDFNIKVAENPIVSFEGDTSVCMPATLRFAGEVMRNDSSTLSWSWNFGNGATARSQFPVSAIYRDQRDHIIELIATTPLGCSDTVFQTVRALPIPQIDAGEDKTIPVGSDTKITATHSPDVININWTPTTALSCFNCPEPIAAPKKTTEYSVQVLNNSGCKNTDQVTVFVFCNNGNLFMPNTFSPNNDGSNDVYYPRGKGLFMVKAFKIFNRWGELIFQKYDFAANDITKGWNGLYNNKPASQDVYIYSVDIVCENGTVLNYRGNIALIR